MIASATDALASMLYMWWFKTKKPDVSMICNGLLAGLVAITAPCAFVNVSCAAIIGLISGILAVESTFFFERKAKIDDPVGAFSVHGVNGAWGVVSLGLFADGTYGDEWNSVAGTVSGLFYGVVGQLLAEVIGVLANVIYVGLISYAVFKLVDKIVGNRVSARTELKGLDLPEMGIDAYSGIKMDRNIETPLSR
jgi:Amt family ammonium transporter